MGSYNSRALFLPDFTNIRQVNKLDNGPAACVSIIPQEQASQISPIHLSQALYSRCQRGEGERGEQSNYNDDCSSGYVGGNCNDDDGNSDDDNGDDGNGDDGNSDYKFNGSGGEKNDDDIRRRQRCLIGKRWQQSSYSWSIRLN